MTATRKKKTAVSSPISQDPKDLVRFVEDLKQQWMATIDALVDPLMLINKDHKILKANLALAKLADSNIRSIVGKKCYEVFAKRDQPCPGCKLKTAVREKKPQQFELEGIRENQFFEVSSAPIFASDGKLEGLVHVYRDRTEAKQLREQLLQSEKLSSIGLLAGGVAHEINNPLSGILVFTQMLLRELPKDSPHYADVTEILNATERCKSIVENLLDFARKNPATKKDNSEDVDIADAARTALRFAKVGMRQHLIEIEENWQDDGKTVRCERNKIVQLFLNLIQNAVQAMPDGGTLSLRSFNAKDHGKDFVIVEVRDSGIGIPEDHCSRIFDPFFTTKEPGEGTGLGLAICYGIIDDLGGELSVKSRINHGSVFRVRLPIKAAKKIKKSA